MEQQLEELVADLFKLHKEELTDTLAIKDVEVWDSLKHMELVVSIEQTFGVELTFDEIVAMHTIGEIKRIVASKLIGN